VSLLNSIFKKSKNLKFVSDFAGLDKSKMPKEDIDNSFTEVNLSAYYSKNSKSWFLEHTSIYNPEFLKFYEDKILEQLDTYIEK